ncbi:hypothetical protein [Pelosinus sp. IPA-1]|uniref:helix-turn-helix transcriptional regulator n=1 Tax=Pelosinus sp. IPA-1 TaxID=3029569 RepID=UPI0024361F8A|nr:hypothetical protein [Pelosinus sp. IPA-1]GMB01864.1 hypothetical protein PIPA1_46640 [Pelosinus sp. IPA-1]
MIENQILNKPELALRLDPTGKIITPNTIWGWTKNGCPSFKVGRRVFYRLESVLKWIDERENKIESVPAIGGIRVIR